MHRLLVTILLAGVLAGCAVGEEVRRTTRAGADIYGSVNDLRDEAKRWESLDDRWEAREERWEYEADRYNDLRDREYARDLGYLQLPNYGGGSGRGSGGGSQSFDFGDAEIYESNPGAWWE